MSRVVSQSETVQRVMSQGEAVSRVMSRGENVSRVMSQGAGGRLKFGNPSSPGLRCSARLSLVRLLGEGRPTTSKSN